MFTAHREGQEEPVNHSLRTVQPGFRRFDAAALAPFSARVPTRYRVGGRLAAQRNDVGPIDLLAARYPVIRRLLGEESFRMMAHQFITGEPPRLAALHDQAEAFPRFLRSRGAAASIE
jgi:Putative DNA-binding domain